MESTNQIPKSFKIILSLVTILAIVAFVSVGFLWVKLANVPKVEPQIDQEAEIEQLEKAIGQFLLLPKDETPTLITLTQTELDLVRGQAFFVNALIGDQVLIYQNNSKAVLWRPTAKKIIEASIIDLSSQPATQ